MSQILRVLKRTKPWRTTFMHIRPVLAYLLKRRLVRFINAQSNASKTRILDSWPRLHIPMHNPKHPIAAENAIAWMQVPGRDRRRVRGQNWVCPNDSKTVWRRWLSLMRSALRLKATAIGNLEYLFENLEEIHRGDCFVANNQENL